MRWLQNVKNIAEVHQQERTFWFSLGISLVQVVWLSIFNWHSRGSQNLYKQLRSKSCYLRFFTHSTSLFWAYSSSVIKTSVWAGLGEGESLWAQGKHREDFLLSLCQAAGLCRVMGVLGKEKDLAMVAPSSFHHRGKQEGKKREINSQRQMKSQEKKQLRERKTDGGWPEGKRCTASTD